MRTRFSSPNVHRNQHVWTEEPGLHVPPSKPGRGRPPKAQKPATTSITVEKLAKGIPPQDWTRASCATARAESCESTSRLAGSGLGRQGGAGAMLASDRPTRGRIGQHDQIQLFERPPPIRRGSNWPRCRGQRYWVERAFEDGKGECGLADYQALGWRSWHHHVTMVILAMLFILEQRVAQHRASELLTPRDIVEMLKRLCRAARRKGGAGGANQRTPPAPPRRHRIPFPPPNTGGIRVRQRLWPANVTLSN